MGFFDVGASVDSQCSWTIGQINHTFKKMGVCLVDVDDDQHQPQGSKWERDRDGSIEMIHSFLTHAISMSRNSIYILLGNIKYIFG